MKLEEGNWLYRVINILGTSLAVLGLLSLIIGFILNYQGSTVREIKTLCDNGKENIVYRGRDINCVEYNENIGKSNYEYTVYDIYLTAYDISSSYFEMAGVVLISTAFCDLILYFLVKKPVLRNLLVLLLSTGLSFVELAKYLKVSVFILLGIILLTEILYTFLTKRSDKPDKKKKAKSKK